MAGWTINWSFIIHLLFLGNKIALLFSNFRGHETSAFVECFHILPRRFVRVTQAFDVEKSCSFFLPGPTVLILTLELVTFSFSPSMFLLPLVKALMPVSADIYESLKVKLSIQEGMSQSAL